MKRLEGRVAFITGGGAGIGTASAVAFAREGAAVIVADIDERAGEAAAATVRAAGGEALFVRSGRRRAAVRMSAKAVGPKMSGRILLAEDNLVRRTLQC